MPSFYGENPPDTEVGTTDATESQVSEDAVTETDTSGGFYQGSPEQTTTEAYEADARAARDAALAAQEAAEDAQTAAEASESSASSSEANAASSESAAATSATNASNSASAAAGSATTAATQASNASSSATAAADSASAAASSESAAASSETAAASSQTAAAGSATAAASSAGTASTKASEAATSATNAAASESAAASSESAAATSATQAANSATNAASSETAAASSETAAASSESAASTSASNAASSASAASSSATAAASSATAAASSATSAGTARDDAQAALDSFEDRYLGAKSSEPTVDNDGDALVAGALFFDTVNTVMKVYDGSQWLAAYASVSGALLAVNNLGDVTNTATARSNLGLGTASEQNVTYFATAAQGALADSALQNGDNVSVLINDAGYATTTYVDNEVAGLVDSAPATLDTLNELAAALGDDANFSTTVTNSIATKWTQDNTKISNWDTAYGWGNHASAGYLTGNQTITLTGDVSGSGTTSISVTIADDSHNHVWGNIDGASVGGLAGPRFTTPSGYIEFGPENPSWAHIYTDRPNFYFNKDLYVQGSGVWHSANDGSGSGLDADLLDGVHGSSYLRSDTSGTLSGDLFVNGQVYGGIGAVTTSGIGDWNHSTNARSGGGYTLLLGSHSNGPGVGNYYHPFSFEYSNKDGTGNMTQFAIPYQTEGIYYRSRYSGSWTGWASVWTSANDGSGSGLDADLLDGMNATSSVTGNTVVARDGNGYIYANHINFSTSETENPTISSFITSNGDGWSRKASKSHVISELDSGLVPHQAGTRQDINFNSYLDTGFFNAGGTLTNGPSGATAFGELIVTRGIDTGLQIYGGYDNTALYWRGWANSGGILYNWHKLWSDQNDGSGSGLDADLLDGYQLDGATSVATRIFNNKGMQHGTYGDFNTVMTPGPNYLQGGTNGPAAGQWYGMMFGLGSDYGTSTGTPGHYASQMYYPRASQGGSPYLYFRDMESGSWGSWRKVYAGYADSAGNAGTLDGIDSSQFIRSDADDAFTGNLTTGANNHITFGPNSAWGSSLRVGGNGRTATGTEMASVVTTDGNLHIDAANSNNGIYLNFYAGTGGVAFGNGASGTTAWVNTAGDMYRSSIGNALNPYWHSVNDGSGSGLDADLLDGKDHTNFGATLATYGTTAGASGRIRCTAPFNANSGQMFQVTVSIYSSYTQHTYVVGGYMYPTTNQWYSPTCVYSGTGTPDIVVGRDANGRAYISIANGDYTGVRVHNMTLGYQTSLSDTYDPWTITIDGATENSVSVSLYKTWNSGNDGSGSGLDADLLDGYHASSMLPSAGADIVRSSNPATDYNDALSYWQASGQGTDYAPSGDWYNTIRGSHGGGVSYYSNTLAMKMTGPGVGDIYTQTRVAGTLQGWNRFWHSNNDGSGSGLDADLLDGLNSSSFARTDVSNTYTSNTINYFQVDRGGYSGSLTTGNLQAYSGGNNSAFMSFHKSGHYAVNMGLDADNVLRIGGWSASANRWVLDMSGNMTAAGNVTAYSDIRLKENIEVIPDALEKVQKIRGVTFTRNDQEDKEKLHTGVIAQEVEAVLPEVISEDNLGIKNVAYGNMVGLLIEAIKELKSEVDDLKAQLKEK